MATKSSSTTNVMKAVDNNQQTTTNQELQRINKELEAKIEALTDQVKELESENDAQKEIIYSLEKDLESALKFSSSKLNELNNKTNKETLHRQQEKKEEKIDGVINSNVISPKYRGIIGIIGAGSMGSQLSSLLSLKKYKVIIIDRQKPLLEKAKLIHKTICKSYLEQNLITKQDIMYSKIVYLENLSDLQKYGDTIHTVIDTAHDLYKKQVLQQLNKMNNIINKKCMIITHSLKKTITEISGYGDKLKNNIIGINLLYFELSIMNNKCIEIIPSWNTSNEIINRCKKFVINDLNRECVVIQDSCSFISNRLLAIYINEAFGLLQSKICSAEQIDKIQRLAMDNMNEYGPFLLADKMGLNVIKEILDELYREYGERKYIANVMLKQYIRSGKWGRKNGIGVYSYNANTNKTNKTNK